MGIKYPEVGICGLSCRLCPRYHTDGESRCGGCKSEYRMAAGCPFITCAIKKKGIEYCGDCKENEACEKWEKHKESSRHCDSFKCYQKLEADIAYIREHGIDEFEKAQMARESLLKEMLRDYNEGRSKSYYCIAATVLEVEELEKALDWARKDSIGLDVKGRSNALHSALGGIARQKNYCLKLRK